MIKPQQIEAARQHGHISIVFMCNALNLGSVGEYQKTISGRAPISIYQKIMLFDAFETYPDLIPMLCTNNNA